MPSTGLRLGDEMPNFSAKTTQGDIKFHEWQGNSWAVLFSHPADYTPVCTTELGSVVQKKSEFDKRNVKLIALSCDSVEDHKGWSGDVVQYSGCHGDLPYPIIADEKRDLAVELGMLDPDEKDSSGMPLTCRAVFIVGPDHRVKLSILYPATTGRNFAELLRVIDSLQLTATHKVATPVDWVPGGKCMVVPSLSTDEAKKTFPKGVEVMAVPSKKEYLRFTPDPTH